MAQIVAHHNRLGTPREREQGVHVPHPMRTRAAQFLDVAQAQVETVVPAYRATDDCG